MANWYHPPLQKNPCISALRQTHSAVTKVSISNRVYCTLLFLFHFRPSVLDNYALLSGSSSLTIWYHKNLPFGIDFI